MKNILILTAVFFTISTYAQEVQIIEKNENFIQKEKVEKFEYIDKNLSLTNLEKIVVLKGYSVNSEKNTLSTLFNTFWKVSNEFGANSYFIDVVENVSDTIYVQISAYYLDNRTIEDNFKLYPQNMVYAFGDLDAKKGNKRKIKINRQKIELHPLEYVEIQNEVGKYLTVSIGGFFGAKTDIKGIEERLPVYLSFKGFGVGPGNFNPTNFNQPSISFNTGRIFPVDMNFGQFLINIFEKRENSN